MFKFHEKCDGCTMQDKNGLPYCIGCCYFELNWELPTLNDKHIEINKEKHRMRQKAYSLKQK